VQDSAALTDNFQMPEDQKGGKSSSAVAASAPSSRHQLVSSLSLRFSSAAELSSSAAVASAAAPRCRAASALCCAIRHSFLRVVLSSVSSCRD
jgi:hypothetical protein